MALLGDAAIAMWADFVPEIVPEFGDWHTHEHMPERLGIPGFLRGTRWSGGGAGASHFIMYELESLQVFSSQAYVERLNQPTPWSRKLTPHHRNMVRSPCRVVGSVGAGVGAALLTIRLSPRPGEADRLQGWLVDAVLPELARRPGLASAHLLVAQPQAAPPQTEEQRLRGGGDAMADCVLLVEGYDAKAIASLPDHELGATVLRDRGAKPEAIAGVYRLDFALTGVDLRVPDRRRMA
jgi:hypothetical protein